MQRIRSLIAAVMVLVSMAGMFSCSLDKSTKAASTGSPKEIIIVVENNLWKSSLSDSITAYFSSSRPGLPQPEPLFNIVQINLEEFNRIFETHRNVLAISIDSTIDKANVEMAYNVWAAPQRVVKITAPTIEMLKESFKLRQKDIFNLYENADIERLQALYSKSMNIKAIEEVKAKFNLKLNIPADYFVAVNKENFIWLRREANILSQGILIYSYPYTDTIAFNHRKILSVRNQYTSLFVPGPSDSSFMVVADKDIAPVTRTLELKKELAVETRGLWEVKNDFMGGPFINYTLIDKKNNMVLALDGYVYAPNKDKTDLLKQVQSILLSFDFIEK